VREYHAAIAIIAGWASIPLGAVAGLAAMQLLSLNVVERPLPLQTVYGISAAIIVWVFVAASLITAIPLAMAVFAGSLSRSVNATAAVMAVTGVVLLPDELGRVFGFPILAGAAAMAYGGRQLLLEAAAKGVGAAAGAAAQRSGQTPTQIFDTVESAGDETPDLTTAPAAATDPATSAHREAATAASSATAVADTRPEFPVVAPAAPDHRQPTRKAVSKTVAEITCQWCSALVPVGATTCPSCNVPLNAPDAQSMAIPGVTEVSSELLAYAEQARHGKTRTNLLKGMFSDTPVPRAIDTPPPSDAAALRPPSRELRAEMARLDAELAAGRANPGGEGAWDTAEGPPAAPPGATPEAPPAATPAAPPAATPEAPPETRT
jgi:hypothetical protein